MGEGRRAVGRWKGPPRGGGAPWGRREGRGRGRSRKVGLGIAELRPR